MVMMVDEGGVGAGLGRTPRVVFNQLRLRVPRPGYRPPVPLVESPAASAALATLRRDGIAMVPGLLSSDRLGALQRAFDLAIHDEDAVDEGNGVRVHEDFFHLDPAFVDVAVDPTIVAVVGGYYRRPFFIGRAEVTRLSPLAGGRYGSFQWHHDTRGRQPKAMVLVNDVDPDGQCMHYLKGSHRRVYRHRRMYGPGSRFEGDLVDLRPDDPRVARVAGPAGTVALFDTNGLHSGNRNDSAVRDTMIVYYTTGRNVRALRFDEVVLAGLPDHLQAIVRRNPRLSLT